MKPEQAIEILNGISALCSAERIDDSGEEDEALALAIHALCCHGPLLAACEDIEALWKHSGHSLHYGTPLYATWCQAASKNRAAIEQAKPAPAKGAKP